MSDFKRMTPKVVAALALTMVAAAACGGGSVGGGAHAGAGGQTAAGAAGASGGAGAPGRRGRSAPARRAARAAAARAGTTDASAGTDTGGSVPVAGGCSQAPTPAAGATVIDVRAPATLASALATAKAGDRIVLHAGTYAKEAISNRKFASFVFVEAAAGDTGDDGGRKVHELGPPLVPRHPVHGHRHARRLEQLRVPRRHPRWRGDGRGRAADPWPEQRGRLARRTRRGLDDQGRRSHDLHPRQVRALGHMEPPPDVRARRHHLRLAQLLPDLRRPRHRDRRQPYQRHDDRGRAHGGRDARRDHAQSHEGYGRQPAVRDPDRLAGHGVGQLRGRREHDLERDPDRQQRRRRLGLGRAARRRARRRDRAQHRCRRHGRALQPPHAARSGGQRHPQWQHRHPDLERHPPVDLPRDRRGQARVRGLQRHLEGRGRRHERRHDGAHLRRCATSGSQPTAPASTQRS